MNFRKIIGLCIAIAFACVVEAQQLEWQFAPKDTITGTCNSMTVCKQDQVCYFLKYTPSYTGTLTSYTLGFFSNCAGNSDPIFNTMSCSMQDNSSIDDYCSVFGSYLFKIKGNNGAIPVTAGVPILLHQVCFDMGDNDVFTIGDDGVTGFTAAIDLAGTGDPVTDFMNYQSTQLNNDRCLCFKPALGSGDPNPTILCLDDLDEIRYDLLNCNDAFVVGLPSGLSVINDPGQIAIDGIPDEAGPFTYTIGSITCDCKNVTGMIQVDSSAIVINNNCYDDMNAAIFNYQIGQKIIIRENVITEVQSSLHLDAMLKPQLQIVIRPSTEWRIRLAPPPPQGN